MQKVLQVLCSFMIVLFFFSSTEANPKKIQPKSKNILEIAEPKSLQREQEPIRLAQNSSEGGQSKLLAKNIGGRWVLDEGKYKSDRKFPKGQIVTIYQSGQNISFHTRYQNGCGLDDNGTATIKGTYIDGAFKASFNWCGDGAFSFDGYISEDGKDITGLCWWGSRRSSFSLVRVAPNEDTSRYAGSAPSRSRTSSSAICFIDTLLD